MSSFLQDIWLYLRGYQIYTVTLYTFLEPFSIRDTLAHLNEDRRKKN